MNNLLYKLTLCKGEPEQEMVYAYLSDDTVKLIEEELSGTKTTNVGHTFVDVANKKYDIGIVDDISCVKDNEYDKLLGEDVCFGVNISTNSRGLAENIYKELKILFNEEISFNKRNNTVKIEYIDYPTSLRIALYLSNTFLLKDNTVSLVVYAETYESNEIIGTIDCLNDDVWKMKPVPNIQNTDKKFHNYTIDKFALLEAVVNMKTKHYLNDFYFHDIQQLSYPKEDKYLWIVRDCGTHLVPKSEVLSHPVVEYYMSQDKNKDYLYYEIDTNEKSLNMGMLNPVLINDINKYINDCKQEAQEKALLEEFMSDIDYEY